MIESKDGWGRAFGVGSGLATLFVFAELLLHSFGKSICELQGCKVVAHQLRYGDYSLLLLGLAFFATLTVLAFLARARGKSWAAALLDPLLLIALATEGYFVGYQVFAVQALCVFCLLVFAWIVLLALLRLGAGARLIWVGFACWLAVFAMFHLVLPASAKVSLPREERLILFYGKDCKHCTALRQELAEKKIAVRELEIGAYANYLKSMGIENVPTLLVNEPYHKEFLTGSEEIGRYLARRETAADTAAAGAATSPSAAPIDLFNQAGSYDPDRPFAPASRLPQPVSTSAPDDGMCKQETPCD